MNQPINIKQLSEAMTPMNEVVISLYKAQEKIYPRTVFGYFAKWRWVMIWLTQLFFYGVPWLNWGDRQAFLFDLDTKRFYIFKLVFYPQDLIYLTAILIISALSLFLFTAIAGRLWCGYACPQTVYTEIFLWIERKIEGDRAKRMKLDEAALSVNKLVKKSSKHFLWLAFAAWTGFTFVGYFTPIRQLMLDFTQLNAGPWDTFWVCFYGFATYGNAGFMREQVCKYMCPYARFQSAMFDQDTLIVTYDEARGEPRGGRSRNVQTKSLGACTDCSLCIQVCPTGIDIRQGLQYECIGCGACADVCNTVMDKMRYPQGLIKYSTEYAVGHQLSRKQMLQRIFRPRVLIYMTVLSALVLGLAASLWLRPSFRVDIVRDRGVMARLSSDGMLENVYRLQIMNATERTQYYQLNVSGLEGVRIEKPDYDDLAKNKTNGLVEVKPAQSRWLIVDLKIPDGSAAPGSHKIMFEIETLDGKEKVTEKSTFIVPR